MNYKIVMRKLSPYEYIAPAMAIFALFLFFPFFKTIYLSLFKTNKMGQAKLFVGAGNYSELLSSASFFNSLFVTVVFVLIVVSVSMLLGLSRPYYVINLFQVSAYSALLMHSQWLSLPAQLP